jgi:hypothetical protein
MKSFMDRSFPFKYKQAIMRIVAPCIALCITVLMNAANSTAGEFSNALSLQGYTGLLNTPNAGVTDEGRADALYSDQKEPQWRDVSGSEDNYFFSVGFFSFAEIGGRLTHASGAGIQDLSANFKIKVPFIPRGFYLPSVAFGMQDVGGGSRHLRTKYAVFSEELWRFRFSLGAGTGPDRMRGVFGGAEFRAFDWLYLLGENDTKDTNVGARLITPQLFGFPLNLQITAKTSLDYRPGNTQFGFGLQIPLGDEHLDRTPLVEKAGRKMQLDRELTAGAAGQLPGAPGNSSRSFAVAPAEMKGRQTAPCADLNRIREKLTAAGFQNVRVGTKGESLLVVEYENNRFNYNELDGLGVVIGIVADTLPADNATLRVVMKKQNIAMLEMSAPLGDFRAFLHDAGKYGELNAHLKITPDVEGDEGVDYLAGAANSSWLDSSLVVYPGLKTFVGTEVGTFDYLLSAKLDYFLNIWKGAVANARYDMPVAWSENFDDGKAFRNSRTGSRFDRLMLFQAIKAAPRVMINLGGGMIVPDYTGTLNEALWTPGDGTHRFAIRQAYASASNGHTLPHIRQVYLGSYRYFFSPLSLSLEGTVGRFFDNDQGFRVEMKRFFGDTAFSLYYTDSKTPSGERVKVGGVMIALPLTPRRDMKPGLLQVRGNDDWSYSQWLKVVAPGEPNTVGTSVGVDPRPPYNLAHIFYNRDRLSDAYIREHLFRLRDAYNTYVR